MVDDTHRFAERKDACGVGSGDFSDAVPDHRPGKDPPGPPEGDKTGLHREEGGLRDLCFVNARWGFRLGHFREQ